MGKQASSLAARLERCPAPIPETGSPPGAGDPAEPGVLQGIQPPPPTHN